MDVLSRGVPLMLEKPMVLRAADARHLVRLANEKRVPLVIGYPYHFVEQHAQLRARIAEGALGLIQLIDNLFASMVLEYYRANPEAYTDVFRWQVTGPPATTYSEPAIAGGGQAQLQVTHSAALLLWLTDLQPREVAAFMADMDVKVDLCDAISVRFDGGAVGTLASTGGIPASQTAHQQLDYRIYGSQGDALLDLMVDEVPPAMRYPQHATSRHLVDLVLGEGEVPNLSSGELGTRVVELLEAAYRSVAERRIVSVEEL